MAVSIITPRGGGSSGQTAYDFLKDFVGDVSASQLRTLYEADNLVFDGSNYIDTEIQPFTSANISKDFRFFLFGITIDTSKGTDSASDRTLCSCKAENVTNSPGFVIRGRGGSGSNGGTSGQVYLINGYKFLAVYFARISGKFYSKVIPLQSRITDGSTVTTYPSQNYNYAASSTIISTVTDATLILGAALNSSGSLYRYCGGSIDKVIFEMAD